MKKADLERTLGVAREAARRAAAHAHRGYRRKLVVEYKGVVDLVTSFDRESETLLRERLAETGIAIVGEEQGGRAEPLVLYIDPIDGTTNFVHGHPFWCVSIGLVDRGAPILGVVVAPALGLEWYGYASEDDGSLATRRALVGEEVEACRTSEASALSESLLATGFPYDRRTNPDSNFDAFVAIKKKCQAIRRCGSAALDLCLVADGTYDGYWERRLNPWDVAGGAALVRAAGGRITGLDGSPDFLPSGELVATNGRIHAELVAELACVRRV